MAGAISPTDASRATLATLHTEGSRLAGPAEVGVAAGPGALGLTAVDGPVRLLRIVVAHH